MAFLDLFKPKWKHSNPAVRAEAVRQLDDDRLTVLETVLRHDLDARIRRIALKKIGDPALLADVAKTDPDEGLRKAAAEKADELLVHAATKGNETIALAAVAHISNQRTLAQVAKTAGSAPARLQALERLTDDRAIADVARRADDAGVRLAAVGRVHEANALREIAIHETVKEVGLAAIEKIAETEALEQVAKRAKSRAVRDAARERLPQAMGKVKLVPSPPAEASPEARRQARRAQLCREADAAAGIADLDEAQEKLAVIAREFTSLGATGDELKKRFDRAAARVELRRKAVSDVLTAAADAEAEKQRRTDEEARQAGVRTALIEKLEALDGEGVPEAVEEGRRAWQELGRPAPSHKELELRFRKAGDGALKRAELAISRVKVRERMQVLADEADLIGAGDSVVLKEAELKLRGLQKRWRELEAIGSDAELKTRLVHAEERVQAMRAEVDAHRKAEEAGEVTRLGELVGKLEALAATDNRKLAEQELKVVQSAFESSNVKGPALSAVRDRFSAAREKLSSRLGEIRDAENWKRWANVPRLEKLVEKMEALKAQADMKVAAAEMKTLQAEWKTVGPAPKEKSEALWARFKAASDEVYGKTHEGFEKLDTERGENLKKKLALCEQAEALASFDVASGTPAAASTEPPDATTTVPAATTATTDTPTATATAAAAATTATPATTTATPAQWKEAAEKVKALQEEWKATGPAPKDSADAVWKRFRAACDRFFEKRKALFGKESDERGGNLKKLDELCTRAEELLRIVTASEGRPGVLANWKDHADRIKEYQAEWKKVGPAPRAESEAAWKRFREACDQFFEKRKASFEKADGERAANLKKKLELCEKAEALVDGEDRDAAMREARALQAEWKKSGPAPREQADAVWGRFREACDKIFDRERRDEGQAEMAALTAAEKEAIKAYGKFENRLPLESLVSQIAPAGPAASEEKVAPSDEKASGATTHAAPKTETKTPAETAPKTAPETAPEKDGNR